MTIKLRDQSKLMIAALGLNTLALLGTTIPALAGASWSANGFAYGTVTANVRCSRGGYSYWNKTGFRVSVSIPGTVSRPSDCSRSTSASAKITGPWSGEAKCNPGPGDGCDLKTLDGLVTPVSPNASTTLSIVGKKISPTTVEFTVSWKGSDAGTAQRVNWFEYKGTIPQNFKGDITELPNFNTLGHRIHQQTRTGLVNKSEVFRITATDANNIIVTGEIVGKSAR
jgi:hypothetical protein